MNGPLRVIFAKFSFAFSESFLPFQGFNYAKLVAIILNIVQLFADFKET
jgi:hypothetical protein